MSAPQRDQTPPKVRQPAELAGDDGPRNGEHATPSPAALPARHLPRPTTKGQREFIRAIQLLEVVTEAFPDVRFDGEASDSN